MDKSRPKSRPKQKVGRGKPIPGVKQGKLIAGQGNGPRKGAPNAGRPPDEWRERLRAMASRDEVLEHVNSVLLAGPEHPFFDRALQYVTEHGYGKAAASLDVTTKGKELTALTWTFGDREVKF